MKISGSLRDFVIILLLSIVIVCVYAPGFSAIFRNDEWLLNSIIEPMLCWSLPCFKGMLSYSLRPSYTGRHFWPVALWTIMLKLLIFGTKYFWHYALSLGFHICNIILVYFVGLKLSSNRMAALLGAIFFGSTALVSDTIFWTFVFHYIFITTITLISLIFHPALNNSKPKKISLWVFYLSIFIAPLVFETGLITILLAMAIFIAKRQTKTFPFAILAFFLVVLFILRVSLIMRFPISPGALHRFFNSGFTGILNKLFFVICPYFFLNAFLGTLKLFLGVLGAVFNIKIADSVYLCGPDFKNPFTLIAIAFAFISVLYIYRFFMTRGLSRELKFISTSFIVFILLNFVMLSFSIFPGDSIPEIVRQLPRFFYLPTAFMTIFLSQALMRTQNIKLFLIVAIFAVVSGAYFITIQLDNIRPYTDSMKEDVRIFRNNGKLAPRLHPGVGRYAIRLDYSFVEDNIRAYLKLEKKALLK